jgi:nitroreductase
MELIEAIRTRYSCRDYLDRPIEPEILKQLLDAARLAPSAKNLQDWRFVIVTDHKLKNKVAQAANNQMFIANAGAIIVACSVCAESMLCGQRIAPIDVAIGLDHITLRATDLGLATCWIGSFYPDQVRQLLNIPADVDIVELMALGYPADESRQGKRVELDQITCYDTWDF